MILLSRHQHRWNSVDCWCEYINVVSSRKEVLMCLDCFFCQNCVFVYEESMTVWFQSFLKTMSSYFWVTPLHEFCLCCRVAEKLISFSLLNQKEEAWTLESLSISFTQWQLIIFHLPGAVGYVFGQKSIFFKHTLLSFKISMINPKMFSYLSLCFCSTNCLILWLSWQRSQPDSISNQRIFQIVFFSFQGSSVLIQDSKIETMRKRRGQFDREIEDCL